MLKIIQRQGNSISTRNILGYDDPEVYKARSSLEIEQMEWPE